MLRSWSTSVFFSKIRSVRNINHGIPLPLPCNLFKYSCFCVASSTAVDYAKIPDYHLQHPWPEWIAFVDGLKEKGYFSDVPAKACSESENIYQDMDKLKAPSMSFARDRYDIFKSLSTFNIQMVVQGGCPNLLRKCVNSAKRLRAYVQLDEEDACGICNLRGSCDRAYVILKGTEATARTVDMVRILLVYALDPLVLSREDGPPGRELVDSAARKLLSELVELSKMPLDPSLEKLSPKEQPCKVKEIRFSDERPFAMTKAFVDDPSLQNVEMKRGDWMCTKCNFMNFSKNVKCLRCNEEGPRYVGDEGMKSSKGDWVCQECKFLNFSRNIRCLKCKAKGPSRIGVNDVEMKKGDWNCPQCRFMNFASNKMCLRCHEPRPKRELKYGEWECPSCDYLNYWKNSSCLKCNCERPVPTASTI